jgi:hypothetical protein
MKVNYVTKGVLIAVCAVVVLAAGMSGVQAQNVTGTLMPVLYDQSGDEVNTASGTLSAGWYYTQPSGNTNQQVYYYGNGTYYDPVTRTYGGSVLNPSGRAGFVITSTTPPPIPTTPGVPNTGAGGDALLNWLLLISAAGLVGAMIVYASWKVNVE